MDGFTDCPLSGCNSADSAGTYNSIDCSNGTDDCKIGYHNATKDALYFIDCTSASCNAGTVQILDGYTGCLTNCNSGDIVADGVFSIDCSNGTDDCKIGYYNYTKQALYFIDCTSASCNAGTVQILDGYTGCPLEGLDGCDSGAWVGVWSSIDCSNGTDDCKLSYYSSTDNGLYFIDCNSADCSDPNGTVKMLDGNNGCPLSGCSSNNRGIDNSIDCSNGTADCKISYYDNSSAGKDLIMADCESVSCNSGTATIVRSTNDVGRPSAIDCSNGTSNCKIAYYEGVATAGALRFTDCDNERCSLKTHAVPDTGAELTWAELYTDTGGKVSDGVVGTTSSSYGRIRTNSALTLTNGEEYTVQIKSSDSTDSTAYIKAARLIIAQSDPTNITNTQTQIEVGDNDSTSSTTAVSLTDPKYYMYDNDKFSGTTNAYFEATLRAVPPINTVNYYFDDYDTGQDWPTNPDYMVDNILTNYAAANADGQIQLNTSTSYSGGGSGPITKVEIMAYGYASGNGRVGLRAVYGGSADGITNWWEPTSSPAWSGYYDITTHANAPSPWTWTDILNLDVDVLMDRVGGPDTNYIAEVQIRVSYKPPLAAYAELYNRTGAVVANSEVSVSSESWDRARGVLALDTNWDKVNDDEYEVRIWADSTATAYISNAKIIIEQNDVVGLTDIEMVHQYNNTLATHSDDTYTSQYFDNEFNKANFVGGNFAAYFETTIKTSNASNAYYAQLDTPLGEVTGTDINYKLKRNVTDIWSSLPGSATNIDVQLRNNSTYITSSSNAWLIIQVSNLQIPENLLLFLPLVIFIPAIFRKGFNSESLNLGILDSVVPRRRYRRKRIYYSNFIEEIDDG